LYLLLLCAKFQYMMKNALLGLVLTTLIYLPVFAQPGYAAAGDTLIHYHGRFIAHSNGSVALVSPAAYAECQFAGDSCILSLSNIAPPGEYNYVAIEVDHQYRGRLKVVNPNPVDFTIAATLKREWHFLRLYKATEAQNGLVTVNYIRASHLKTINRMSKRSIEFIGNSITCGFGNDFGDIPCGGGSKWYDQHNAYWSYASRVGRSLDAHFMLSAISGAGIYRNWNSEGPTVPQQYESAYLQFDSAARWDFASFIPDVVLIALGTNDLSMGDGKTQRKPFDSAIFVNTYIAFLKTIYYHYPATQVVLLTSPMVRGKNSAILLSCLKSVQKSMSAQPKTAHTIKIFTFRPMQATGCDGHPSLQEHEEMARELIPFMKKVLKEN
jgi:lysophospholipase L1-like esterase